jgi:hypothetical protein
VPGSSQSELRFWVAPRITVGQSESETQTTDVNSVSCSSAGNRAASTDPDEIAAIAARKLAEIDTQIGSGAC